MKMQMKRKSLGQVLGEIQGVDWSGMCSGDREVWEIEATEFHAEIMRREKTKKRLTKLAKYLDRKIKNECEK